MRGWIGFVLLMAPSLALAVSLPALNVFSPGGIISSSQVNANFQTLYDGLRGLSVMTGDAGSGGTSGFVPAPPAGSGSAGYFLRADATWAAPPVTPILPVRPQGRLTLTSGKPVMSSDVSAGTVIYYDSHEGSLVPIYGGASFTNMTIPSDELSLSLSTGAIAASTLHDVYAFSNSGTLAICAGPAWSTTTVRGASAQLQRLVGIWTNSASISCSNGGTSFTVAANQGTYLGTFYATAAGQTAMQFQPSASGNGSAPVLGLYNAYNRVRMSSVDIDANGWSYGTFTWRCEDASSANSVTFVEGLPTSPIDASFETAVSPSGAYYGWAGLNIDVNCAGSPSPAAGQGQKAGGATGVYAIALTWNFYPVLGMHSIQALEDAQGGGSVSFNASGANFLRVSLEM